MLLECGSSATEIAGAEEEFGGLGLFIRSLVGLERQAAVEAFSRFLTDSRYTSEQISFLEQVIDELTANGAMPAGRLYEPPYTDNAPRGPDMIFPSEDVDHIVSVLDQVRTHACVDTASA